MKYFYFLIVAIIIAGALKLHAQLLWEQMPGIYGGGTPGPIVVTPENHLYTGFGGTFISGVHYSTNEGNTWEKISPSWDIGNIALNQSGHIFISTRDMASSTENVFTSTDNGNSWANIDNAPKPVHSLVVNPVNDYLFIGSSDGVYRSVDGGANWTQVSNAYSQLLTVAPNGYLFAALLDGGQNFYLSTDDGDTWEILTIPGFFTGVNSITISKNGVIYFQTGFPEGFYLFRSCDYGLSWEKRDYGLPDDYVYSLTTNSLGHVFAGTDVANAKVFRSTNNGYSWHPSAGGLPTFGSHVYTLAADNNDRLYAGLAGFYRTEYSTASQTLHGILDNLDDPISNDSPSETGISFSPPGDLPKKNFSPLVESVEISIDEVLHTRTGDLTFTLEHNGVIVTLISEAGMDGQDFISTLLSDEAEEPVGNGTAPFTEFYKPEHPLSAFKGMDPYGDWILRIEDGYAGNDGILNGWSLQIMLDSPTVNVEENLPSIPSEFTLYQNFPNPFNPSTIIQYEMVSNQFVILKVYDLLGREMATLVNEVKPAGSYEVTFDPSAVGGELTSGVFFYSLRVGNFSQTKKMVLIR